MNFLAADDNSSSRGGCRLTEAANLCPQRKDLDRDFMECIDDVLSQVIRNPELYPIVYRSLRRAVVRRFPSLSFMKSQRMRYKSYVFHSRRNCGWQREWNSRVFH